MAKNRRLTSKFCLFFDACRLIIMQQSEIYEYSPSPNGQYVNSRPPLPWGAGGNAPSNPYLTRAWPHALETVRLEKSPCALAHGAFFSLTGPRKRLYGSGRPMAEARSIPGLWGRFTRQDVSQEMRGPGRVRSTRPRPRPVLYFQDSTKNIRGTFS